MIARDQDGCLVVYARLLQTVHEVGDPVEDTSRLGEIIGSFLADFRQEAAIGIPPGGDVRADIVIPLVNRPVIHDMKFFGPLPNDRVRPG